MYLYYLAETYLLWIAFLVLVAGIAVRLVLFVYIILKNSKDQPNYRKAGASYILSSFGRWLIPFNKAIAGKPLYAALRYVFHACLILVPLGFSSHIMLWEGSRFEWSWPALPDRIADWMTIIVLGFAGYFLIRRIVFSVTTGNSSIKDYVLLALVALPFATGYFLAHGTFASVSFLGHNMYLIHLLSSEAMLIMAAFLFVRTNLKEEKCIACDACALSCPTGTLEFNDQGRTRSFRYCHFQCISCGACVNTCPEEAAELRHDISFRRFLQGTSKEIIRSAELAVCRRCGLPFLPIAQLEKLNQGLPDEYIFICTRCKREKDGERLREQSPWTKKIRSAINRVT